MNGQMWRMTTNNKEEQMQAQKEKHNVKQENWQGDWHNLQNSDCRKSTVLIQVLGSRTTHKKARLKSLSLKAYFHGMVLKLDCCAL